MKIKIRNNMLIASDGVEPLACLRRQGKYANTTRPDLILLELKDACNAKDAALEEKNPLRA